MVAERRLPFAYRATSYKRRFPFSLPTGSTIDRAFQVKGDPGDLWYVDVAVKSDGNTMEGTGNYRGSFGLRFTRTSQ